MERNERTDTWAAGSRDPGHVPQMWTISQRCPPSMFTGGNGDSSEKKPAVGKKITSCGDSKLVREIHHCVSKDENIHSVDCECAAVINDSAQSVLLSRLLNQQLGCHHHDMTVRRRWQGRPPISEGTGAWGWAKLANSSSVGGAASVACLTIKCTVETSSANSPTVRTYHCTIILGIFCTFLKNHV